MVLPADLAAYGVPDAPEPEQAGTGWFFFGAASLDLTQELCVARL